MPLSAWASACLLLANGPSIAATLEGRQPDDLTALLQSSSGTVRKASAEYDSNLAVSRYNLTGLPAGVHCADVPDACKPPFNCNMHTASSMYSSITYSTDGHANYNSWCHTPYLEYALKCQRRAFPEATVALTRTRELHPELVEMDGQYCFAAGHCENSHVSEETTLEQMEDMCDDIFGHGVWTSKGLLDLFRAKAGKKRKENEYAQLACAMGNFHCDVLYCKEKFCEVEHWRKKYGHLAAPDPPYQAEVQLQQKRR
uniref:Uncharacterized protein n=1 Tax=Alexandrium andersonii TaxID=327968 RepID=A0A7S2IJ08_9DINO